MSTQHRTVTPAVKAQPTPNRFPWTPEDPTNQIGLFRSRSDPMRAPTLAKHRDLYVHDSAPSPSASESERHQEIDEMNRQGLIHHVTQATRQQQQEQLQELEQATQSIPPVPCGSDYDDDLDELAIFGDDNFEYVYPDNTAESDRLHVNEVEPANTEVIIEETMFDDHMEQMVEAQFPLEDEILKPPSEFDLGASGSGSSDHARWLEEIGLEQEREELALRERCYHAYISGEVDDLGAYGSKRRLGNDADGMQPESPSGKRART